MYRYMVPFVVFLLTYISWNLLSSSIIESLPEQHGQSSWVLALLGKCHFELNQYRQAQEYFRLGQPIHQSCCSLRLLFELCHHFSFLFS